MNNSPYCYEIEGGSTIVCVEIGQAYDQIPADPALTSINENYMIGIGNLNLKVQLNKQNS